MDGLSVPRRPFALAPRGLRVAADDRLVAQVRAGSQRAFEAIYDRHHAGLLSFCRHMLGTREEAEDAVQQTFIAAYRALLADDREILLKAWLYTIARNRCLSVLRARREHVSLADDDDAAAPATAGLAAQVERRDDLRALLDDLGRLPDDQRAALVLAELGAHSHEEIGLVIGVPTAKIKALVFQAREALVNRRVAREADCVSIREQLADSGGSARRRLLRQHVAQCDGCRAFAVEVRRQRAALGVLLPVAPTLALKHGSLTAAFAAGPAAAGGAAAAGAGGASVLSGASTLLGANAVGAKALVTLAVVGAGGGYAAVHGLPRAALPPSSAQGAPAAQQRLQPAAARSAPGSAGTRDSRASCGRGGCGSAPPGPGAGSAGSGAPAAPGAGGTAAGVPRAADASQPAVPAGAAPPAPARGPLSAAGGRRTPKPAVAPGLGSARKAPGVSAPALPAGAAAHVKAPSVPAKPVHPATPSVPATPSIPATPAMPGRSGSPRGPGGPTIPAPPALPGGQGVPAAPHIPPPPPLPPGSPPQAPGDLLNP
jgi:RNA polymerase sigma factor (sigma-70 family)